MSTSTKVVSPRWSTVSIASRVVPGISETITRSRPTSLFRSDDLPTFGRPRIATRIASVPIATSLVPGQARDDLVEQVAGAVAVEPRQRPRLAEPEPVEDGRVADRGAGRRSCSRARSRGAWRRGGSTASSSSPGRDPGARVDDEQHEVGLVDRGLRLLGDLGAERPALDLVDAARVDQPEPGAASTRRGAPCGRA